MNLIYSTGLTTIDQYIYAVGGYDSEHQLSTVERYDTETNVWEFITPMLRPRSALSVAVINNKLFALGDYECLQKVHIVRSVIFTIDTHSVPKFTSKVKVPFINNF